MHGSDFGCHPDTAALISRAADAASQTVAAAWGDLPTLGERTRGEGSFRSIKLSTINYVFPRPFPPNFPKPLSQRIRCNDISMNTKARRTTFPPGQGPLVNTLVPLLLRDR